MINTDNHGLRLKICGITQLSDALYASGQGVDAIGFVFYADSPRYISPNKANSIIQHLPPFLSVVGLFVNPSQIDIDNVLQECHLDVLQLHGDEAPEFCAQQHLRVVKALPITTVKDLDSIHNYQCSVLLDAKAPQGVYGGTGTSFNWSMLKGIKHTHPIILAGGIDSQNIDDAMGIEGLYALDISSGVESSKGIKDHNKIKEICEKF
ncbi:MAG: phosphoribosylanthranilate isomerase [Ghiorsea sp.]